MRNIATLIEELRVEGVGLNLKGDDLEISLFNGEINDHSLELIKNNKDEIKEYITSFVSGEDYIQIPKVAESVSYAISDAQRILCVLSQFEGGSVAYNMTSHMGLDGEYDVESFKRAIDATIERHEILRTVFKENEQGEVRQWILSKEELGFEIDYKDYRGEENKEEQVKAYITSENTKAFDLEN